MKKMLFLYNPKSGTGQIRNSVAKIIEIFSEADYDVTIYPTKAALDARDTVCERAADFDIIVCGGGDGTLDEVVTGLMISQTHRTVGYIPAGSTNDFGNTVGIPRQPKRAAKVVVDGQPFLCDIGRFNQEEYFVYVAAFGLMTNVSYETGQDLKNVLGHAAYIVEGLKSLGSWESYHLEIESEEYNGQGDFIYGMVSNSNSVAGIKGFPGKDVSLDDGLFEVTLVRTPEDLLDLQNTIGAFFTGDENSQAVIRFKTKHVIFTSDEPLAWTRDGENGGMHVKVELEALPKALKIMVEAPEALEEREE